MQTHFKFMLIIVFITDWLFNYLKIKIFCLYYYENDCLIVAEFTKLANFTIIVTRSINFIQFIGGAVVAA